MSFNTSGKKVFAFMKSKINSGIYLVDIIGKNNKRIRLKLGVVN